MPENEPPAGGGAPAPGGVELGGLPLHPGLCATCVHRRLLRSPRSTFLRCAKAEQDASFPRYPRLPVAACAGYSPGPPDCGDAGR